ncbi:helix-turn-helix domain-containing protein [Halobacterium sp. NMX12-1]|uniref:Helix-turn-helix domain-containing protein n=1 Tax=Halobacterium sp. NMX12-1 TaxID=3166650 RepID=A0AAU8CA88_9EURY
MAVRFDDYDPDDGRIDVSDGTNAHTILSFLAENPDIGFTPKEIHEQTGVPRGSVGSTLARLEEHGLVRHKGDYWAVAEDDRLGSVVAMNHSFDAFAAYTDRYADNDDWAEDLPDLDENHDADTEA